MLHTIVVVAVLASGAPASPVVISDLDLQSAIQQQRGGKPELFAEAAWDAMKLPEPLSLLRGTEGAVSIADLTSLFQKTYHLPRPAARDFLTFEVLTHDPKNPWEAAPHQAEGVEAGFASVRGAPGELAPVLGLVAHRGLSEDLQFRRRLLVALDSSPEPVKLALQLLPAAARGAYRWSPLLAAYAVGRAPTSLPEALQGLGEEPDSKLLAFRLATHRLSPSPSLSAPLLRGLLEAGLDDLALGVLASTPSSVQQQILEGKPKAVAGVEQASGMRQLDLRILIAAAVLGRDGRVPAERWLGKARVGTQCGTVAHQMLSVAMQLADPDRFQLLVGVRTCDVLDTPSWLEVQQAALGGAYPDHVIELGAWARSSLEYHSGEKEPLLIEQAFTRQAALDLDAARAHARARVEAWIAARPGPTTATAAPGQGVARRMLASPPKTFFTEHKLREWKSRRSKRWESLKDVQLPRGFRVVRAERKGTNAVAVALSQRLDPTGEVSGGGYWLLLSGDGGASWEPPLYTGLRTLRPYVVAERSSLPILEGEEIRLEAAREELDEGSITFPPVCLRTGPRQEGLVLVSTLGALRRDSDGDGLPDVVEERLMLDPLNPDSDGDGFPDGSDPAPHVPNRQDSTRDAELLSELLARLTDHQWRLPGIEPGLPRTTGGMGMARSPESVLDVLFVEAATPIAAERGFPVQVMVLTPDEVALARERFGSFYPLQLRTFFDAKHENAYVEWDEGWRGGTVKATWKGSWTLEMLRSWIT